DHGRLGRCGCPDLAGASPGPAGAAPGRGGGGAQPSGGSRGRGEDPEESGERLPQRRRRSEGPLAGPGQRPGAAGGPAQEGRLEGARNAGRGGEEDQAGGGEGGGAMKTRKSVTTAITDPCCGSEISRWSIPWWARR